MLRLHRRTDGCEARKAPQRDVLDETLARMYPTATWGQPDDEARFGAGVRPAEVRRLARSLSVATKAPTFVRAGRRRGSVQLRLHPVRGPRAEPPRRAR